MLHRTVMDLVDVWVSVVQTSIGTKATMEIDVSHALAVSKRASSGTVGAAYLRSLQVFDII